ncbi:MAG: ArsC/Spx/MgsR family protein [Sulfurimicrobium sp.]
MSSVIFYEKPGCTGNARQKALLREAGHAVEVRNLLVHPWTADALRSFFGSRPVAEWFNTSAPRVKSGEVSPQTLDEAAALALMLAEPLLIRRPLIECDGRRECGFDATIERWLAIAQPAGDREGCPRNSANSAPESHGCAVPTGPAGVA